MIKHLPLLLIGSLLGGALSAAAQAQASAGTLQPVQSIALGTHAALGGTVQLPNHHTVLLLTDTQTAWQTNLDRYQRTKPSEGFSIFSPLGNVAIGRSAKEERQREEDRRAALLLPVNVFTNGNEVLAVEHIWADAVKKQAKGGTLKLGQVYVQRLDEKGQLTKALFEPRPEPESRKTEDEVLGRYADPDGYVEVVRETNKREESLNFFTIHYDLKTKAVRREALPLPATPAHVGNFSYFRHWYQEWAYLGHRANQTYFCRRTLVNDAQEKAGSQPLSYQVYIADDHGVPAGGFRTTLSLAPGTVPLYSGLIVSNGELEHIPQYYSQKTGRDSYTTYDEWDTSTGGVGSFYLDHASGDVIIFGEYGEGSLPVADFRNDLSGYFEQRFSFDGQVRNQVQALYTTAMRADKRKASFVGQYMRSCRFHLDPLTSQSQFSFSPLRRYGAEEDFDLFLDENLKMQRHEYLSGKKSDERLYTLVRYAEPYWIFKPTGSSTEMRVYEHAASTDLPLYASLEKLRRNAGSQLPDHELHLSMTGPGTGLVVERPQYVGGNLQVYKF